MARNRRKADGEVTWGAMLPRLTIFILIVGLLIGLSAIQRRNLMLGEDLRKLEQDLMKEAKITASLKASLNREISPRELDRKMATWRIAMVQPSEAQIRRLRDPEATDAALRPRILAQAEASRAAVRAP
jgi:hypothetical protein